MSKHQEFIDAYAQEIGPTPTPEQALLLAYFREAVDDLLAAAPTPTRE